MSPKSKRSPQTSTPVRPWRAALRRDPRVEEEGLSSEPSAPARSPGPGDLFAARYRLEDRVGRGGMGDVWAAYDTRVGLRVALKIVALGEDLAGTTRRRFEREAALSRQLKGSAFVEVFDQGVVGDQGYLAMELLEGESLLERLQRLQRLSSPECLALVRGVALGLRLAHALQISHRDLKPGNVFFARTTSKSSGVLSLGGRNETVKLLDFGIAKDAWDDARLTRPGVMLGSAFYMSPEQIRNGCDVDVRTDLWSMGILLYRSLTGSRPFTGSPAEALGHIVYDDPPRATSLDPDLPSGVDTFFRKALQKDPAQRFQSIDELIQAFVEALDTEPQSASSGRETRAPLEPDVEWVESLVKAPPATVLEDSPPTVLDKSPPLTLLEVSPKATMAVEPRPVTKRTATIPPRFGSTSSARPSSWLIRRTTPSLRLVRSRVRRLLVLLAVMAGACAGLLFVLAKEGVFVALRSLLGI